MRGKYEGFMPYDPFAIIAIIGTYIYINDPAKAFHKSGKIGSYLYHINKLKSDDIDNKDILPDNIRNDIKIYKETDTADDIIETLINKEGNIIDALTNQGYNSIKISILGDDEKKIEGAYKKLKNYVNGNDKESLTKDKDTLIKETIISNINKFYDLFDTRDEYYMNYLKKIKYIGKPEFGHYQGARYAYHIADYTKTNIDIINTLFPLDPNILFMFKYCCNLCFSSKYLFNDRLKNYGILEEGTTESSNDYIEEIPNNFEYNKDKNSVEYESSNVNINKEDIPAFSEYEYVFKYFRNLSILGPFILLIIVLLLLFYWVLDQWQLLGVFMTYFINYPIIYVLNLIMNSMYYFAYYFMLIFGLVIVHPLNVIMLKLPNILIFVATLFIILLIDPLSLLNIGINMRPFAFILLDFVYITLVQLIKLFIELIIIIFSYTIVSIPILIYVVYALYKITYQDLTILTDPHINFSPYKSGIMMIYFQMMRNDYFNSVLSNHIDLVNKLGKK